MTIHVGTALREAGRELGAAWPRLLATDLLMKGVTLILLVPLSGLALRVALAAAGEPVLADQDLLWFALRPAGVLSLVVLGSLALAILAMEQASLMAIAYGAAHRRRVSVRSALTHAFAHAAGIGRVSVRVLVMVLAIAAPFLAAMAWVGLRLLTEFDINFYLTNRPPEFWTAAVLVGALTAGLAAVLVPRLLALTYALPILLFEGAGPAGAVRLSRERARGSGWQLAGLLVAWAAAGALAGALGLGAVGWIGRWVVPRLGVNLPVLLVVLGLLLVAWTAVNLGVTLFQNASFAVLVTGLYETRGHEPTPRALALLEEGGPGFSWIPSSRSLALGAVILTLASAGAGLYLLRSVRVDDDVLVIAHRGASGAAPENTLAAVERAIADRADVVEVDVQETADGQVVVAHDLDLMKVARTPLAIWQATMADLAAVDVGSWFGPEFADQRVPTLGQVLEAARNRARVDIELKYYGHDERLEERVVEVVEDLGMEDQVMVMSLKASGIREIRRLRPHWPIGLLTATAVGDLTRVDADFLAVNTGIATDRFLRSAHAAGKDVYVWTVNDPILMWQLIGKGVDGLITDEPALARQVLEYRAELSPVERLLVGAAIFLGEPHTPSRASDA